MSALHFDKNYYRISFEILKIIFNIYFCFLSTSLICAPFIRLRYNY